MHFQVRTKHNLINLVWRWTETQYSPSKNSPLTATSRWLWKRHAACKISQDKYGTLTVMLRHWQIFMRLTATEEDTALENGALGLDMAAKCGLLDKKWTRYLGGLFRRMRTHNEFILLGMPKPQTCLRSAFTTWKIIQSLRVAKTSLQNQTHLWI